ncbi:MAG: carbohydrate ABC transporter permease [Chloroflexi bacterium]|nr:carbohydrate ABC transporter permease [Chloroflexota bacterium]MBV9546273.1 carbohydrate ABC transporter permease [Chloroflexota bacterium]
MAVRAIGRAPAGAPGIERAPIGIAIAGWLLALIGFFPVLYLVATSLKTEAAAVVLPPTFIPLPGVDLAPTEMPPFTFTPTFEQYQTILDRGFGPFFARSVLTVVGSTLIVLLLAVPCAYALAFRMIVGWRDSLFFFISTKFLPPVGIIVPIYIIMRDLQLLDNIAALLIMYTAMNLPIAIWMLRSFFEEIPRDVLQAAQVDGADVFTTMTRVILPMVTPGLTATIFIGMIFAWNEFFFAVSLTATKAATVPMFMIGFITSEGLFWAKLAAAGTMAMLPVVIAGWAAQRQLVRGLSLGAVK